MKSIPWFIIVILMIIIAIQHECSNQHQPHVSQTIIIDTVIDTIVNHSTSYYPKFIYCDTGSVKWLSKPIDTASILSDYFSRILYIDTLQNDSNAFVVIVDTISRNRIVYRQKNITLFPRQITKTELIKAANIPSRQLFIGAQVNNASNSYGFSPTILYQSKKETTLSFSYDIFNKSYYFGVYFPLRYSKK
jgi:hypothetical protein